MEKHYKVADFLAKLLDKQFSIFGFKFGIDPLIGLIPGVGDFASFVIGAYIVWIGVKMRIPSGELKKMVRNLVIDLVLGFVPILGDLSDFVFRAHVKNLEILEKNKPRSILEGELVG